MISSFNKVPFSDKRIVYNSFNLSLLTISCNFFKNSTIFSASLFSFFEYEINDTIVLLILQSLFELKSKVLYNSMYFVNIFSKVEGLISITSGFLLIFSNLNSTPKSFKFVTSPNTLSTNFVNKASLFSTLLFKFTLFHSS